ncbi:arrestin domain-containing protein 17 isoform X1 [Episyrphus balteatus]|uniref:arrestin domain-containing protein 17 isoform X1 n=1 Tax=Episyrphus balteatus TaxID=286459 RepID=UPI0024861319|nr:arrestin domain-containing protein 17 isoform X1 [Episyrphus balteatus]
MPIECLISFDHNPQGVYYSGQELSGVVELNVETTKRIKAIHITVSGYAKVRWIKKGYPRDSERAACRAYKSYLSSRSYVLGSCSNSSIIDWLPGEYTYAFHVILPNNLPTSFDGKYGQIHYEIVTTIDRPGRYPKVYKLPFTVIHPIDLNSDPIYRVPLEILDRKRFWSFCCPTGPLTVKFSTPYCGYAPGQKINFVLYINNESSIDITECDVKLKQEVRYESHNPQHEYRLDKNLIARKKFGNVLRWSRKVYRGSLEILSIPPSSSKFPCPIVVSYFIKIIIKPTDFHWKVKLKIPLTIGSMPIMDQTLSRHQTNEEIIQQQQQTPALIVTDSDNPPEYVPMVPPSYEDAMALSERFFDDTEYLHNVSMTNITTDNGESFKPRYPVYYDFMTPFIPPENVIEGSPSQLRLALQDSSPTSSNIKKDVN